MKMFGQNIQQKIGLIFSYPSFFVEESLASVDRAEGSFAQLPVDDDPVPRDLPLVQGQHAGGGQQPKGSHPLLRLLHFLFVPRYTQID